LLLPGFLPTRVPPQQQHRSRSGGAVASVLKNRNKTNAITMAGQAASWIMEIWYIVIVGVLSTIVQVDILREISVVVKALEFCLIPFVQIYTSAPIRRYLEANN
jgi:hypothetical protein